jgi:hypothetical protein
MKSKRYAFHAEESQSPSGDCSAPSFESENAKAFAAAADFIREGIGADANGASWDDLAKKEQLQVVRLTAAGLAVNVAEGDLDSLPVLSADTSEHKVLMPLIGTRVTKVTWPGVYGQIPFGKGGILDRRNALPSEYLYRQALQIEIFASDIRFEGISVSSKPSIIIGAPAGEPSFVISQGFVTAANSDSPTPSDESIAAFMEEYGFNYAQNSYFGWIRAEDGVAVVDAKPDNFILSVEGVVPIDLQIAVIPEFVSGKVGKPAIILP